MVYVVAWIVDCVYESDIEILSDMLSSSGIPNVIENSIALVNVCSSVVVVDFPSDFVKPTV